MGKIYGALLAIAGFIASLFIANQRGKRQGKEEGEVQKTKDILKNVKETQDRINKYNSISSSDKRDWLRKRKNRRNK
jgi:gas vesicle protein